MSLNRVFGSVVGWIFFTVAIAAAAQETITLKVADNLPTTHFVGTYGTKYFMEEVTKATNGQVKFEYYPSEQLGKARDMLTVTQKGVADIGLVVPSYITEKMPLSAAAELPGDFKSSVEGMRAYWKLAKDGFFAKNEFAPHGVRVLFVYVNPPYQILMRQPFERLADLKGKKIRAAGNAQYFVLDAIGAVPVRMSAPEVNQALSRGTVDGINFPIPTVFSYDLQNLVKGTTEGEPFGSAMVTYVMSETRWHKLPENVRKAITEVGERTTERVCTMTDADVAKGHEKLRALGVKTIRLNAEDQIMLKELAKKVAEDWVKDLEGRGKPGKAARAAWLEALGSAR